MVLSHLGYVNQEPKYQKTGCLIFLRHGSPLPRALHQSGLTTGKRCVHGEPKFIQHSKLCAKHLTQGAEHCLSSTSGLGKGEMHTGLPRQAECKGMSALWHLKNEKKIQKTQVALRLYVVLYVEYHCKGGVRANPNA